MTGQPHIKANFLIINYTTHVKILNETVRVYLFKFFLIKVYVVFSGGCKSSKFTVGQF